MSDETARSQPTIQLTREELIEAITEGVSQAFAAALKGVDLAAAVEVGIASSGIAEAIKAGAFAAFDRVYGSEILGAIADGTREAIRAGR